MEAKWIWKKKRNEKRQQTTTHSNIKCIANSLTQKDNFHRNVANTQSTHSRVTYHLPFVFFKCIYFLLECFFFSVSRYFVFKRIKIKLSTWWVCWVAIMAPGIFHTFLVQCLLLLLMNWHLLFLACNQLINLIVVLISVY